jgi:hypothetical protein
MWLASGRRTACSIKGKELETIFDKNWFLLLYALKVREKHIEFGLCNLLANVCMEDVAGYKENNTDIDLSEIGCEDELN